MASWVVYPSQVSQPPDFTDALNTSTRRHHSKSRTGCNVCKKRRIKCDETKPACRQCVDYDRECIYTITASKAAAGEPQQSDVEDHDVDKLFELVWEKLNPLAEFCSLAELSIQKVVLRNLTSHFVGCKDEWLAAPLFQQLLQKHGVQLGVQSDYLLHAILAVAASHLQYLDPGNPHLKLIYGFHNSLSLRHYHIKLNDIKPEDADALFACGAIHTIMNIRHTMVDAVTSYEMDGGCGDLLLGLESIKSFPAFHCPFHEGNRIFTDRIHRVFPTCDFSQYWNAEINQDVSNRASNLAGLDSYLCELAGIKVFEDTYRQPFQYLTFCGEDRPRSSLEMLFSFPSQLKMPYFEALQHQSPVAILILGYWLAMFSTIKQWWITEPAMSLCAKFHAYLLVVLPEAVHGREALLAPLSQAE